MFDTEKGEFTDHFAHVNDIIEKGDYKEDTDRSVVTIGTFHGGRPSGLTWQWRSKRILDGFLYGRVHGEGKFTGDDITFIYPDFLTGLRGTFVNGVLEHATAVNIVAERCVDGLKELKLEASGEVTVKWKREEANTTCILDSTQKSWIHMKRSLSMLINLLYQDLKKECLL